MLVPSNQVISFNTFVWYFLSYFATLYPTHAPILNSTSKDRRKPNKNEKKTMKKNVKIIFIIFLNYEKYNGKTKKIPDIDGRKKRENLCAAHLRSIALVFCMKIKIHFRFLVGCSRCSFREKSSKELI